MKQYKKYSEISKMIKIPLHAAVLLYGASMAFLFYKQTGWSGGAVYESDLPVHIRMIVEDGWYYSLTAFVYKAFYAIPVVLPGGVLFGDLAIALFLALCGVASVYLTAALLRDMQAEETGSLREGERISGWDVRRENAERNHLADRCGNAEERQTAVPRGIMRTGLPIDRQNDVRARRKGRLTAWHLLGGLILNLVMPCYVRGIADGRYIGMESASIWHNSTYIVMKMTGLFCILYYGKLAKKYKAGISGGEWLAFTVLLSVCTAVKPSFLLVFAPTMAVFLLAGLLRGTPLKKVIVFGSVVFLPLLVVLFQNVVLFGAETGNGWEIRPGYALSLHSGYPFLSAVFSVFFPLAMLLAFWRELRRDAWFSGAWLMALFGFLEVFLFAETGSRAGDGNFMWGYSFAILMIFAAALVKWGKLGHQAVREERSAGGILKVGAFLVSGLILGWHLYCGIYFYGNLLRGVSYYMWD